MLHKIFIAAVAAAFALPLCAAFPLDKKAISYLQSNATAGPSNAQYTYSQSSGRFQGKAYDGGYIDVVGCSGASGACRNNPSCQCKVDIGPLPRATCVFARPTSLLALLLRFDAATRSAPKLSSRACPPATTCAHPARSLTPNCVYLQLHFDICAATQTQATCVAGPVSSSTAATVPATQARAAL
jgi:hypothetical protein